MTGLNINSVGTRCRFFVSALVSILKINGGLSGPFEVQRGVRQGSSLLGMLYSLAIEPLLHNIRKILPGVVFPRGSGCFKISVYADVVVFIKSQRNVSIMEGIINNFSEVSSARVNWAKSEALAIGEGVAAGVKLPGGLVWKRGGIKYFGVFVGRKDYMKRNWENTLEIVEGGVRKWRWIFSKLSYKGRVLVLNNPVSSMLWHRLTCVDPPPDLPPKVQAI